MQVVDRTHQVCKTEPRDIGYYLIIEPMSPMTKGTLEEHTVKLSNRSIFLK